VDQIVSTVTAEINRILADPVVVFAYRAVAIYLVILWLASAYWVYRDLDHRTGDVIAPYLASAAVVLFTPLFFPLAIIAYRIVRPQQTLAERRDRELRHELLVDEMASETCERCGRTVDGEWLRCPACGQALAATCHDCGARVERDWSVCAWCAAELEERPTTVVPVPEPATVAARLVVPETTWAAVPEPAAVPETTAEPQPPAKRQPRANKRQPVAQPERVPVAVMADARDQVAADRAAIDEHLGRESKPQGRRRRATNRTSPAPGVGIRD